ncbi:hypothetical protein L226DRAFT_532213 [Lentinus tigrinus ALCF2SS1-7]|uniref:uncharacterized protein n=1 Tax=Lentinus tigrinus ALCF2SS1-7 TaxID=1328758 RepID=UPI00116636C5|nr:hypothetical protein L226DRAFT_532213 [Lentinus tigrinus ALCF2SS1-7]
MSAFSKAPVNQDIVQPPDAKECTSLRFEWTVRGLKTLFENSKGEAKSKVIKSPRFGEGRWQILFYANSGSVGQEGQTFVSLYLACEPTAAEKEKAVNGKWIREGMFNFEFAIRNVAKTMEFGSKSAHDHSFHYPGAQNWGWAQFARREAVYYLPPTVKQQDAFMITCSITSSLVPPAPMPAIPRYLVPKDLLDSMGSLLDDPLYSDVEFVLPRRGRAEPRRIYASKKLLRRVDYYDTMFSSGFSESAMDLEADADMGPGADDASVSDLGTLSQQFDDSDFDDDDDQMDNDADFPADDLEGTRPTDGDPSRLDTPTTSNKRISVTTDETIEHPVLFEVDMLDQSDDQGPSTRNTRPKLSHPSTPRSRELALENNDAPSPPAQDLPTATRAQSEVPGPRKTRVVVRDVAYTTYCAVLYYIYTDMISFAPLSSSFLAASSPAAVTPHGSSVVSTPAALPSEAPPFSGSVVVGPRSRREWMAEWERSNPGRMRPPSAKSVYRLAEQLGLQDLKERAFQHIVKSLTVDTVVHEVFSAFSAAFEDVRKVELQYMSEHWNDVRNGAMLNIGQFLRSGRYPGFDEVWPVIIQNLITEEKKAEGEQQPTR